MTASLGANYYSDNSPFNHNKKGTAMYQISLTPSAGKRLVAKATVEHPAVKSALREGTIVIVAGTTNGYVAEELLSRLGQEKEFNRKRFFRGITLPPTIKTIDTGRLPDESQFPGDVVITNGVWQKGKTIFDVIDDLKQGDVILKGANCVNLSHKQAGILIGHPKGGTIVVALQAVVGRRVKLILPVGLEKRVSDDLNSIAALLNDPGSTGPRLLPVPGEIITELDAITLLSGAQATLVAGGGICGAEGSVWIAVDGMPEQEIKAKTVIDAVVNEPAFSM
jgi:hypothetical protein